MGRGRQQGARHASPGCSRTPAESRQRAAAVAVPGRPPAGPASRPPSHPQGSQYDEIYEKEGWPTRYEQLVDERKPLEDVTCPVCGAHKQTVRFRGADVRCTTGSGAGQPVA